MADFLGKRISLISKAGIRYEGILYTIDPTEATVALSKVKSFGTEERPSERFIPPRDEIFEFIIFRGSDIRDLHVCESSLYRDDSAIVKIMSPPPAPVPQPLVTSNISVPLKPSQQETTTAKQSNKPIQPLSRPDSKARDQIPDYTSINVDNCDFTISPKEPESKIEPKNNRTDCYDSDDLERIAHQDFKHFMNRDIQKKNTDFYYVDYDKDRLNFRRNPRQRGFKNAESRKSNNYDMPFDFPAAAANRLGPVKKNETIAADFDFESSNALIAEELASMSLEDRALKLSGSVNRNDNRLNESSDENPYYNRTKSFFDNISSDITDRQNLSGNRRSERKLNYETFGDSEGATRNSRNFRGNRGFMRGSYNRGGSVGFLRRGNPSNRYYGHQSQKRSIPVGGVNSFEYNEET